MKRFTVLMLTLLLLFTTAYAEIDLSGMSHEELAALRDQIDELLGSDQNTGTANTTDTPHMPVAIKASPDKSTWYIQDYVGRNAAGFGYTSLGGDRLERYGAGYVQFIFMTENGAYLDFEDESLLKQYVVIGQSQAPNTELKLTLETDSKGKEYSNLVAFQNFREIDLLVRRVDGVMIGSPVKAEMVAINPTPDKYTAYIKNYVGKNVASFGYTSWGGDRMDEYGGGHIKFLFIADDGAYIDPEDYDLLKRYVVTGQDIAPNSEMRMTYLTDSNGKEYDNLIDTQTYNSITLYVQRLADDVVASTQSEENSELGE